MVEGLVGHKPEARRESFSGGLYELPVAQPGLGRAP